VAIVGNKNSNFHFFLIVNIWAKKPPIKTGHKNYNKKCSQQVSKINSIKKDHVNLKNKKTMAFSLFLLNPFPNPPKPKPKKKKKKTSKLIINNFNIMPTPPNSGHF
jgi:hypothetical protein